VVALQAGQAAQQHKVPQMQQLVLATKAAQATMAQHVVRVAAAQANLDSATAIQVSVAKVFLSFQLG
jgi:hypothetical protein